MPINTLDAMKKAILRSFFLIWNELCGVKCKEVIAEWSEWKSDKYKMCIILGKLCECEYSVWFVFHVLPPFFSVISLTCCFSQVSHFHHFPFSIPYCVGKGKKDYTQVCNCYAHLKFGRGILHMIRLSISYFPSVTKVLYI